MINRTLTRKWNTALVLVIFVGGIAAGVAIGFLWAATRLSNGSSESFGDQAILVSRVTQVEVTPLNELDRNVRLNVSLTNIGGRDASDLRVLRDRTSIEGAAQSGRGWFGSSVDSRPAIEPDLVPARRTSNLWLSVVIQNSDVKDSSGSVNLSARVQYRDSSSGTIRETSICQSGVFVNGGLSAASLAQC